MALITTSIKPINPSYFTIVCTHPGSATCLFYYRNVLCRLYYFTDSFVFHCVFINVCRIDGCIAARVFNKLTYLLTYLLTCPLIRQTSKWHHVYECSPAVKLLATTPMTTDMYEVPDAVPHIHAVSSHVATDKDPSK